jgi:hypothetical protein
MFRRCQEAVDRGGVSVPMSSPRYTAIESTDTSSTPFTRADNSSAREVLPVAVAPTIARSMVVDWAVADGLRVP